MAKRLTYAMVGGGPDGFIGDAHRRAIGLDGTAAIAAGVFSRNREKSLQMAEALAFPRTGVMRITRQWPGLRGNVRTALTL